MNFEEWFEKYNYQREYTVEEYVTARTAWNAGMNALVTAHQIRPRGKSIVSSCPECGLLAYKHKLDCSYGR